MSCASHQFQSNEIIYPKNSLLKYEPPRLMSHHDVSNTNYKNICRSTISPAFQPSSFYDVNLNLLDPYSNLCRPADILDFLFPPLEFLNKTHHKYIICVSRHPASQIDVYNLEINLDYRLKQTQALEVGLCDRRRQIYNECFDELIRQITIECSERGILFSRIRHTYRQLMTNYFNNYISSNAYAMRTLLVNERMKMKLNNQIDHLQYEIDQLKNQLMNAEDHYENILRLYSRFQSTNEYRSQSITTIIPLELQQLRTINNSLKQELENILVNKLNFSFISRKKQKI